MFGGRVSSRTTCSCCSCSSAASSIVTMRSRLEDEPRQNVQQRGLAGAGTARDQDVEPGADAAAGNRASAVSAVQFTRSLARRRSAGNRRIESSGPSTASGGMIALTREPSGRRASTTGGRLRYAPPQSHDDLHDQLSKWAAVLKDAGSQLQVGVAFEVHLVVTVHQDIGDALSFARKASRGLRPEQLVQHVDDERPRS